MATPGGDLLLSQAEFAAEYLDLCAFQKQKYNYSRVY